MQNLCLKADFLMSAVTASSTLAVATEAAKHLQPGSLFLDLNSASPGTKKEAAQVVEAAGGRYMEAGPGRTTWMPCWRSAAPIDPAS